MPTRVYGWRITNKYYLVTRYLLVGMWDSRFSGLSVFMTKKVKIVEQITGSILTYEATPRDIFLTEHA